MVGPPTYACPVCALVFNNGDERLWHVGTAHPIERPVLLIAQDVSPAIVNIRKPLPAAQIDVANCTSAFLSRNGSAERPIDIAALGQTIADNTDAELRLRLLNERARDEAKIVSRYTIRIVLARPAELTEVDRLFVRHIAVNQLTMRNVAAFAEAAEQHRAARFYTDALVAYATGVLIKEGTDLGGATLPFSEFQGKYMQALAELHLFPTRPVAASVVACIGLNLNDFSWTGASSGIAAIDEALTFFAALRNSRRIDFPASLQPEPAHLPICPVDRDTHEVLTDFTLLSRSDRDPSRTAEVAARAADGTLSPFDRAKLSALAAARRLADGEINDARAALRSLANDPTFGEWATTELERIDPR
jgi:hypothetical protein